MKRWLLTFAIILMISGLPGSLHAEEKKVKEPKKPEKTVVTEDDKKIIEIADMLAMMDLLENMECIQDLDLFMKENTNGKEN